MIKRTVWPPAGCPVTRPVPRSHRCCNRPLISRKRAACSGLTVSVPSPSVASVARLPRLRAELAEGPSIGWRVLLLLLLGALRAKRSATGSVGRPGGLVVVEVGGGSSAGAEPGAGSKRRREMVCSSS